MFLFILKSFEEQMFNFDTVQLTDFFPSVACAFAFKKSLPNTGF